MLPLAFRALLDDYPLHDARVTRREAGWDGRAYTIDLVPDVPGGSALVLTYVLVSAEEPQSNGRVHAAEQEECYWLYDEVEVVDAKAGVFSHTVLFSDGTELRLPFTDFRLELAAARSM